MIRRRAVGILFIGNSLTRAENMLDILVGLAQAGGVNLEVTQHSPDGATLAEHAANSDVHTLLSVGNWDYVVQEQSQRPAVREEQVRSVGLVFYMHAAKRDGDPINAAIRTPPGRCVPHRLHVLHDAFRADAGRRLLPSGTRPGHRHCPAAGRARHLEGRAVAQGPKRPERSEP